MSTTTQIRIKQAPAAPGVYFFRDSAGRLLYIGKSANLKARLASYFPPTRHGKPSILNSSDVGRRKNLDIPPFRLAMTQQIADVRWLQAESEIEALILESRLIKKHRPKYNILLRDDKNYFFVGLEPTKENFPRLIITHQPFAFAQNQISKIKNQKYSPETRQKNKLKLKTKYIGPFTDGKALKRTLQKLRKIFPYRACKNSIYKPCLHYDLGLCPAHIKIYGGGGGKKSEAKIQKEIAAAKKKHNQNLKAIFSVLYGTKINLLRDLKKEMAKAAKLKEYEKAAEARDEIASLSNVLAHERVLEPEILKRGENWEETEQELRKIANAPKPIVRVEAYDISNISGQFAVGSMIVFQKDRPDKTQYRRFRIKTVASSNDVEMMKEILTRRFNHLPQNAAKNNLAAWPSPDLIVIDGGKPQLGAAMKILAQRKIEIPLLAIAKKEEEIFLPREKNSVKLPQNSLTLNFIRAIRDEAHRFAISYYRKLHKRGSGLK